MANFTLINKAPSKKAVKGSKGAVAPHVKVSEGIVAQVYPDGAAGAAQANQIQVTLMGGSPEFRGQVNFKVGEKAYSFHKGDSHALWFSHQDEAGQESLGELFLSLVNGKKMAKITDFEEIAG